jgi:hypothetical protein
MEGDTEPWLTRQARDTGEIFGRWLLRSWLTRRPARRLSLRLLERSGEITRLPDGRVVLRVGDTPTTYLTAAQWEWYRARYIRHGRS